MRRTLATLVVVASPILLAAPVGAREARIAPAPVPAAVVPALPATAAPGTPPLVAPAAEPAPAAAAPVRQAVQRVTPKPPAAAEDGLYTARLGADLCAARAVFCGLDHNGRYPAR
ncbi:MAG TPA: hypothetical protein VHL53_17995 [Acidimicrobiia bacterium]|nr:hypothetical protein [Acidimicrobiia bacterium]